ncbi:MAG: spore coat protein, partial [Vicinamibacteria bacterium]
MSVHVVVTARMASARCPGKALAPLAGRPLLAVLLLRMRGARGTDGLVFATSTNPENDALAEVADALGVRVFRGDEDDVLRR